MNQHAARTARITLSGLALSGLSRAGIVSACFALSLLSGAPALAQSDAAQLDTGPLRFRGVGPARQALDAMQFQAFDPAQWSLLSAWSSTNGKSEALTPESTKGKVVMIVTWASWYKLSHTAMRSAQSLFERYKDKGLIVVGVHNPRGFDAAEANAKEIGVTFPFASDAAGKFRAALKADQDPNIYFIDRAGQLRFAQIESASAEQAASTLLGESVDQARAVPGELQARKAAMEKDKWKTTDASGSALASVQEVKFDAPSEDAYEKTKWPYNVGKIEKDKITGKQTVKTPTLKLPEPEEWMPAAPKNSGRIMVLYFIDPTVTDAHKTIQVMNSVQAQYHADAVVAGAILKTGEKLDADNGDDDKRKERNTGWIKSLFQSHTINHPFTPKTLRVDTNELSEGSFSGHFTGLKDDRVVAILVSTDLKVRWLGSAQSDDLRRSLDKLLLVDPGVLARRKAEQARGGR